MVVLDKFRHFILDSHPYTAATISQLFLSNVYRLHGLPVVVVSHRDAIFTRKFWQHLFKLVGKPRSLGISVDDTTPAQLSDKLQERSIMQALVHQHLLRAQGRMQCQVDKRRSERSFEVGDWVYMKL